MLNDILPPERQQKPKPHPTVEQKPAVAAVDSNMPLPEINIELGNKKSEQKAGKLVRIRGYRPRQHWYSLNKTEKIMAASGLLLITLTAVVSFYVLVIEKPKDVVEPKPVRVKKVAPKPTTVAAPLTGLQIDPALANRPVTAIMIENSLDARPQSGLQDAGVVYEAIAEGGVTRFMALFQDTQPQYIGPVRSLRPYYIDFAVPFDASVAHVGGSPDALAQIRAGMKDLDQFFNSGAYWRQSTRAAPHNVYTSFAKLDALNSSKGYTTSKVQSWPRKADEPLKVPTAKSLDFNISGYYYNPHFDYDPTTNTYLRSEAGKPHIVTSSPTDATGVQLHPKVVIALVIPLANGALDSSGAYYSNYSDNGSGTAYIFQDGGVTQGTWTKAGRSDQFTFTDSAGNPIKLDAGQTWLSLVSQASRVSYKP